LNYVKLVEFTDVGRQLHTLTTLLKNNYYEYHWYSSNIDELHSNHKAEDTCTRP